MSRRPSWETELCRRNHSSCHQEGGRAPSQRRLCSASVLPLGCGVGVPSHAPSYGDTPTTLCCNFAKLYLNPHAVFALPARLPFVLQDVVAHIDLEQI